MKNYKKVLVLTIALSLLFSVGQGFAEGGQGGGNNPLTLEEVTPNDGASGVAVDSQIKFTFSNNVINMKVKENNKICFSLKDNDGKNIPFDIVMADDQIEKDKKNDIILVPTNGLEEGKEYSVTVSSTLQAKNGKSLEEDIIVTFATVGGANGLNHIFKIVIVVLLLVITYVVWKRQKKTAKKRKA